MAAEKAVALKAVSAFPQNNRMNDALWMLQKKVKEKSKGMLEITWGEDRKRSLLSSWWRPFEMVWWIWPGQHIPLMFLKSL